MNRKFKAVIGLEVHVELNTESKMFCSCSSAFGAPVNSNICPVCFGLPGALPKLNKRAVELAIKAGLALNCSINRIFNLDRKNYYYPDNPKNYQITQKDYPLCYGGSIEIEDSDGNDKTINIERIHIEEDAGKLLHLKDKSLIDFNRAGTPLMEIVTMPDITSPKEAVDFLKKLKRLLTALGVSDCKMEEGSLRCDGNISLYDKTYNTAYNKVELKNINSFKALEKAFEYEVKRQSDLINCGKSINKETRRWDEQAMITQVMRKKEKGEDYRYLVEGDASSYKISEEFIDEIKRSLPELPEERYKRFIRDYGLLPYEADLLCEDPCVSDFFEEAERTCSDPKAVSNWILGELFRMLKEKNLKLRNIPLSGDMLGKLILLIKEGSISSSGGKAVFERMFLEGKDPKVIVTEEGLLQNSDGKYIESIVDEVFIENPKALKEYKSGKENIATYLIGMSMKKSKGKANPVLVKEKVLEKLKRV